jgi:hypothetical protein
VSGGAFSSIRVKREAASGEKKIGSFRGKRLEAKPRCIIIPLVAARVERSTVAAAVRSIV